MRAPPTPRGAPYVFFAAIVYHMGNNLLGALEGQYQIGWSWLKPSLWGPLPLAYFALAPVPCDRFDIGARRLLQALLQA